MSDIHIEVSDVIDAHPETIYAVVKDYREAHPAILPEAYFADLTVVSGGSGAGTVIDVQMSVYGMKRAYHMTVTEPEPGRILIETDDASGITTRFIVDPLDGGERSQVTIASDMRLSPGLMGLSERLMNPPITRRIYRAELQQLAAYLHGKP